MKVTVSIDGQTYVVDIEDINKRPIVAMVDGERFEIQPETEMGVPPASEAAPAKEAGSIHATWNSNVLLAPLPGTIAEIFVLPGAKVEPGQPICVIEAMKMKNIIHANRSGTIANVSVSPGQPVKHRQVLVEFAD